MDEALLAKLVCPRDRSALRQAGATLTCSAGHDYPIVDGIPVLLLADVEQTLWVADASLRAARAASESGPGDGLFTETLGISPLERQALLEAAQSPSEIDPVVRFMIAATSGILYKPLLGSLRVYPIPDLRLPHGNGETFLDIGCNWGRWCVAAGRAGYRPLGIDPSLGAVMAARRVCSQLGIQAQFVVGDARHLPFPDRCIDVAFSYSVLQHFDRTDARRALAEVARVLEPGGTSLIQMPNAYGLRSLYHQARRGFRPAQSFDVRYWRPAQLKDTCDRLVGATTISVDGFFGLGIQKSDAPLLPPAQRMVVNSSEALRSLSARLPWLTYLADSLYVASTKAEN